MARYGPESPLVVDGQSWKSALAIPRGLWGLFLSCCLVLAILPLRLDPDPRPTMAWWIFPLVGAVAYAVSLLLPPWLTAHRLRQERPRREERANGRGRVFVSASEARKAYVTAATAPFAVFLLLATVTVAAGVGVYLTAGKLEIGLALVLVGTITIGGALPTEGKWRRRAEEAYLAQFPSG